MPHERKREAGNAREKKPPWKTMRAKAAISIGGVGGKGAIKKTKRVAGPRA